MRNGRRTLGSVVLDLDGVLWIAGAPGEGAIAFLDDLRRDDIPFCLLTNDCSVSRAERHEAITQAGLVVRPDQLVTAAEVTRSWLRDAGVHTIMYLGAPSVLPDVTKGLGVRKTGPVDAVVVGDLFASYDRKSLDKAAKAVSDGAALVAMQRNPLWSDGKGWYVDNGFWVAGLEYVTGRQAVVTGKPNRSAYLTAVARLGVAAQPHSRIAFVSDDIATDVKGAKDAGLTTVYFGSAQTLPPWVDFAAPDMGALASLLIGHGHD